MQTTSELNFKYQIDPELILSCIRRGWVITPLLPKKKTPRGKWKDLEWQFTTEEQVLSHWLDYPNDNYGIITGLSKIKVVDIDCGNKIDNDGNIFPKHIISGKVIQEIDENSLTLSVKSSSGGFHYYYQTDEIIEDRISIVEGIDIKGDGYVVGFGSYVKNYSDNKKHYIDGFYELLDNRDLLPFPKLSFIEAKKTSEPITAKEIQTKAVELYNKGSKSGSRNNDLFTLVAELAQDYRASNKEILRANIKTWNRTKVNPSLDWEEFDRTFESAWNTAQKKVAEYKEKREKLTQAQKTMLTRKDKPEQPVIESTTKPQEDNSDIVRIMDYIWDDRSWLGDGTRKVAYYETGIDWIDDGMKGIQKRTILTAPSNTGKTLLAIQIAKSASSKGKPVLYIDLEQTKQDLGIRLLTSGTGFTKEDLIIKGQIIVGRHKEIFEQNREQCRNIYSTDLNGVTTLQELETFIDKWAEDKEDPLVVIDQISGIRHLALGQTMTEQTLEIANWIRYNMKDKKWTSLMLSPENKAYANTGDMKAVSGSGELVNAVDALWSLQRNTGPDKNAEWDRENVTLNIAKTRSGKITTKYELKIQNDTFIDKAQYLSKGMLKNSDYQRDSERIGLVKKFHQ
jgi:KaiC/GvpD/RAD55 family RecA-like ATPase